MSKLVFRDAAQQAVLFQATVIISFICTTSSAWPVQTLTNEDYARAERFLSWNSDRYVINDAIQHHWLDGEDRLWYVRENVTGGRDFLLVDASTGKKSAAFNQHAVAIGLSQSTHTKFEAEALPFSYFRYVEHGTAIQFHLDNSTWTCATRVPRCTQVRSSDKTPGESASPDGRAVVYINKHNLWARDLRRNEDFALTQDGEENNDYARPNGDRPWPVWDQRFPHTNPHGDAPGVLWSPDSRYVLTYRLDDRNVKDLYLIQSTPDAEQTRPRLYKYKTAIVGDLEVPKLWLTVIDIGTRQKAVLNTSAIIDWYRSPINLHHVWWSNDSTKIFFIQYDRFAHSVSLCIYDLPAGTVREVIRETSSTTVRVSDTDRNQGGVSLDYPDVKILANGDIIWFSERDGWGHLYYYQASGNLRNQITKGDWVVRGIVHVDEHKKQLYFLASGREPGRDPYERHLYRINFDGSGLRLLTPEDAEHGVSSLSTPFWQNADLPSEAEVAPFSPSGRYFVDSFSRPDRPSVFVLRAADGRLISQLEQADISKLSDGGYTAIEPFKVTAADGKTAIYGNILRPSGFDPTKKYPIIDSVYPGPQNIRTAKTFSRAVFDPFQARSLAELGFIVVTIDGRGTAHRSKAFMDYSYGRLDRASELQDHISGIRQLAQRYPYMDVTRVGIEGASGGGYAAAHAVLAYPDFYKVAVSASGDQDNRRYGAGWGETFIGPVSENERNYTLASNIPLARNLKGKLLLMHGELDDNVPPSLTLRLVNSLIQANKDFDLLIIPNGTHTAFDLSYFIRRKWDYFVRNLLGAEPPHDYFISEPKWVSATTGME